MILLIDDNLLILRDTSDLLRDAGYSVATSVHPRAALRIGAINLVICDIGLPGIDGIDGIEFVQNLRILRPSLPVIFTTAGAPDDLMELAAGIGEVLLRPFDGADLLAAVKRALPAV